MRILIIDDHDLFRRGLAQALQEFEHRLNFFEAASMAEARSIIQEHHQKLDLVLLDYNLPDGDGLVLLQDMQCDYPLLPTAMLSAHEDPKLMREALTIGALGYIPKSTETTVLLSAIRLILTGGTYIPPHLLPYVTEHEPSPKQHEELTPRQLEVLDLMYTGLSNKEIANKLFISDATVKAHITAILKHKGVSSRTKLLALKRS